jgi:hypothetical protein
MAHNACCLLLLLLLLLLLHACLCARTRTHVSDDVTARWRGKQSPLHVRAGGVPCCCLLAWWSVPASLLAWQQPENGVGGVRKRPAPRLVHLHALLDGPRRPALHPQRRAGVDDSLPDQELCQRRERPLLELVRVGGGWDRRPSRWPWSGGWLRPRRLARLQQRLQQRLLLLLLLLLLLPIIMMKLNVSPAYDDFAVEVAAAEVDDVQAEGDVEGGEGALVAAQHVESVPEIVP